LPGKFDRQTECCPPLSLLIVFFAAELHKGKFKSSTIFFGRVLPRRDWLILEKEGRGCTQKKKIKSRRQADPDGRKQEQGQGLLARQNPQAFFFSPAFAQFFPAGFFLGSLGAVVLFAA